MRCYGCQTMQGRCLARSLAERPELPLKKLIRTAQNFFPYLAEAKNDVYHVTRKYMGFVHDREFRVVQLLPERPDDLYIDVGANRGQSILAIRHYRPGARIVSFEPNPVIFQRLTRLFGTTPGVELHNVGLAPEDGESPLYIPSYRRFVYDGLATFSRSAAERYLGPDTLFFFDPGKLSIAEYRCVTRPLDSFGLAPTFIKIDVEGFEYEVLQGAAETLRKHSPVLMLERYYKDDRVTPLLKRQGYREVVVEAGTFVPGRSTGLNMVLMKDRQPVA